MVVSLSKFASLAIIKKFETQRQLLTTFLRHVRSISGNQKNIPPSLASVKHITIQTCGPLYEEWRETKRPYAGAPKEGLTFNVEYVDTKEFTNDKAPVVLALHGAPGSHRDYESLINYLTPKGVRLIAPNFPEYSVIDSIQYFRHSVHERKSFIMDFLRAIKISKLDMLVTHSSAVYPALDVYVNEGFPINSITLISPGGHRRTQCLKPAWFVDNIGRIGLSPMGRAIFRKIGLQIMEAFGSKMRLNDPDAILMSSVIMFTSEFERLGDMLRFIAEKKPEFLLIFGDRDKLIEKETFYEMGEIMGANESHYSKFNKDGKCLIEGNCEDWIRLIEFIGIGHFPFKQLPDIVNCAIEEKLRKCQKTLST